MNSNKKIIALNVAEKASVCRSVSQLLSNGNPRIVILKFYSNRAKLIVRKIQFMSLILKALKCISLRLGAT